MALWLYGYFATGNPSLIDWHANRQYGDLHLDQRSEPEAAPGGEAAGAGADSVAHAAWSTTLAVLLRARVLPLPL